MTVSAGGSASSDVILGGGSETVLPSGFDLATTISSGGSLTVSSGGVASAPTISGAGAVLDLLSGAVANFGTIGSGGSLTVSSGGLAAGVTTISSGGSLTVSEGGSAAFTTISSGGSLTVSSGGTESAAVVFNGGSGTVRGYASLDLIDGGGSLIVSSGGFASKERLVGSLTVSSGGSATSATIYSGGSETVFSGGLAGSTTISGSGAVLDLLSGAIASGGITFAGSGGEVKIDGASLPTDPSLVIGATLAGLAPGDRIDLPGIAYVGGTAMVDASNVLQVNEGGKTYDIQFDQPYTGHTFGLSNDGNNGTAIYEGGVPCFCRGTLIRTDTGEVPVEALAIGDRVITLSGAARPVKWIGRRAYDPRFAAGNRNVLPIRIEADALADGVPSRDLWVSPQHALCLGRVLVPAQLLINDATITQPVGVDRLEYFHLDLGTHDVIVAEGAAAESYVDCDNRGTFHNEREFARLYRGQTTPRWEFCARRMSEASPELAAIRYGVLARARAFGRFTDDPDLHLVVGDTPIRPQLVADRRLYRFVVPTGGRSIVLASRSTVPLKSERSPADGRRLGVAVERIVLRGAGHRVEIEPDCPALCNGFHDAEPGWRWTDGRGHLPGGLLAAFGGDFLVEVYLAQTDLVYGLETQAAAAETPQCLIAARRAARSATTRGRLRGA